MAKLIQLRSFIRHSKTLQTSGYRHIPHPTGPHKSIGYRDFLLGNSRQTGLLVRLFYPTPSTPKADPAQWPKWLAHEHYAQGMVDLVGIRSRVLSSFFKAINPLNEVRTPAIENGPLLPAANKQHPLIVFSHGLGGDRFAYTALCLEFVSRGFVVAAVEHRDNSAALSFYHRQKGTRSPENEQHYEPEISHPKYKPPHPLPPIDLGNGQELVWIRHRHVDLFDHSANACAFRHRQVVHRAAECSRAVDFLQNLNEGGKLENAIDPKYSSGGEFKNTFNTDKMAIMGHSFGGATTLLSAIEDARFKVAVGLDAWAFPLKQVPLDTIKQPVLLVNAETLGTDRHNVKKFSEIFQNADPSVKQAVTITGSTHMQQCDVPFVFSQLMSKLSSRMDPKSPATIDSLDVHDLTWAKALQFISKYLDLETGDDVEAFLSANEFAFRPTY